MSGLDRLPRPMIDRRLGGATHVHPIVRVTQIHHLSTINRIYKINKIPVALHLKRNATCTTLEGILVHATSEPNRAQININALRGSFIARVCDGQKEMIPADAPLRWTTSMIDLVIFSTTIMCFVRACRGPSPLYKSIFIVLLVYCSPGSFQCR